MTTFSAPGGVARAAMIVALVAASPATQAQVPSERDVRRPDGTIIKPFQSAPPAARSGYDSNATGRTEQENARKVRAEENQRRLEEQIRSREDQLDQTKRQRDASATSPAGQSGLDRAEQVERSKRARDAAADTPLKRQ
jgi:hypothetical protein